jgi:hypothetical protein
MLFLLDIASIVLVIGGWTAMTAYLVTSGLLGRRRKVVRAYSASIGTEDEKFHEYIVDVRNKNGDVFRFVDGTCKKGPKIYDN